MPPLALPTKEFMEARARSGRNSGLPALTVRVPWHGYTLGDWTETWETFARRAVAGEWEKNGEETAKRVREGVEPETPVWLVEKERNKIEFVPRRSARQPGLGHPAGHPRHRHLHARSRTAGRRR